MDVSVTAEQCSHRVTTSAASHPISPTKRLQVHKTLGGDTGQLTSTDQRDNPHHADIMPSTQSRGEGGERGVFGVMDFVF